MLFDETTTQVYESQVKNSQGIILDVIFHKASLVDSEDNIIGLIGVVLDITEKNRLIRERDEIAKRAGKFFEQSINLLLVSDFDANILEINTAIKRIFDYDESEVIGASFLDLVHPEDVENTVLEMKKLIDGQRVDYFENRYRHKNGTYRTLAWSANSDLDKKLIYASSQDITSMKIKNKLLLEQSRLAAMGEMIGNIAHQWRQPLSVISTASTGMKLQNEFNYLNDETINKLCDAINNNAQYLSKTIDDFRNYIRGERVKSYFYLKDNITSFLQLIEGNIKNHNITLVLDIDKNIQINSYSNELIQCWMNIVNNAKDALLSNNISTKYIFISTSNIKNNAIIRIKDNAGGIAQDILSKIFEPYFTTKHSSQGTGLGLHLTHTLIVDGIKGFIEANNVTFEYEDKKYKGAEFIITLPLD